MIRNPGKSYADEELRDRVTLIGESVIIYREIDPPTPHALEICFDRIAELVASLDSFQMIVDLSEAGRPDAQYKALIEERMLALHKLRHLVVVMGDNVLLRIAAKFILAKVIHVPVTIASSLEQAIAQAGPGGIQS